MRRSSVSARESYVQGSAARNLRQPHSVERSYRQQIQRPVRRIRIGDVIGTMIVAAAFAICAMMMVNYVRMQSDLTAARKSVARMEVNLTDLKSRNDARYSEVMASVNLEEIETIARDELGMGYAQEGQIIHYSTDSTDYMRKVTGTN